jgi:uncharacterized membrane protein YagU involved in acid resistance
MYQNPPTKHSLIKEKKRGIYEKYGIEINVAVDVVVDVLGEPDILGGSEAVYRGQRDVIVAISSHCFFSFAFAFVFLLLSRSRTCSVALVCLSPGEWDLGVSAIWLFLLLFRIFFILT